MTSNDFQQQIWPLRDRLFRFAFRLLSDEAEAADTVQETLIKIWDKREDLERVQNKEAWCLRLIRNASIDRIRGGYRKRKTALDAVQEFATSRQGPGKEVQLKDTVQQVHRLMKELPEAQRAVMQLRDIEGMSYQEIADALELTMAQVKTNLHRARNRVRQALLKTEQYGL